MRLYSGAPFWLIRNGLEDPTSLRSGPFPTGEEFDVAVIGAGLTGALVADTLTAERLRVVVLDRRAIAAGSTAATTALVTYELDVELRRLSARIGTADAVRAYQLNAAAVGGVGDVAATLDEDCGCAARPSLYLASRPAHARRLEHEADLRQKQGLDAEYWTRRRVEQTYGFRSYGALRTGNAAVVDPVRLTRGLLRRAAGRGAVVLPYTELHDVASGRGRLRLRTSGGVLGTQRIVFATGYETPAPLRPGITALHSTYALATEPIPDLGPIRDGCLVWETARPYFYMRTTTDGRILAGGADAPFQNPDRRDALLPDRIRRLEKRLRQFVPDIQAVTAFSWAGTFAETPDGLPFIGPTAGFPRALFALGYGGNGITAGVIAAGILRDFCLGRPNADARLFRLDR
jgi:glycine/D-amino acid oxidase-like deaminating enzyme